MIEYTLDFDGKAMKFYVETGRHVSAPLHTPGHNMLDIRSKLEVDTDLMIRHLLDYLRGEVGDNVNYQQGQFSDGSRGAPQAHGVFYNGEQPTKENAIMLTQVMNRVFAPLRGGRSRDIGKKIYVYPLTEEMFDVLKQYAEKPPRTIARYARNLYLWVTNTTSLRVELIGEGINRIRKCLEDRIDE